MFFDFCLEIIGAKPFSFFYMYTFLLRAATFKYDFRYADNKTFPIQDQIYRIFLNLDCHFKL